MGCSTTTLRSINFFIHIRILQGLKFMHVFFKMPIYVAVSIIGNFASKQQTLVGEYFNVNPTSNFPMRFYIEEAKFHKNHLVLIIQLWSSQILGEDKLIKELFDSCGDMWATQFVRSWHRTRKQIIVHTRRLKF